MCCLLLLLLLGWAIAVLIGIVNVHFRDTRHLIDIALQVFFYLTPVMYKPGLMEGRRTLGPLLRLNPLVPFLQLVRDTILTNKVPPMSVYATASLIVAVFLVAAGLALWNEERRLVFHL